MKRIAIVICLLLAGCDDHEFSAPDKSACTDYRIITFYDNKQLPWTNGTWSGAKTLPVCVVGETKIPKPAELN